MSTFKIITDFTMDTWYYKRGEIHIGVIPGCHTAADALFYARAIAAACDSYGKPLHSYVALQVGKYIHRVAGA